jgi:hypothetical protein
MFLVFFGRTFHKKSENNHEKNEDPMTYCEIFPIFWLKWHEITLGQLHIF